MRKHDEKKSGGLDTLAEESYADMEMHAEARFILDKIGQISPHNHQAIYLRFVEGLTPPEIAEILGISTDAASVRINRGLQELRVITGTNSEKIVPHKK